MMPEPAICPYWREFHVHLAYVVTGGVKQNIILG
jgi:hypothetical protein